MFRRRWSGLPKDPEFPSNLEGLGYFINDKDEIRSIKNPDEYFKYFLKKNERWNERQRFAMNTAVLTEINFRLVKCGMKQIRLHDPNHDGYIPVLVSNNISAARHIVVIIGESVQDIGVLAHRVIGGPGGINKGSLVDTIDILRDGDFDTDGDVAVAIANPGQCYWWPEGGRALSHVAFHQKPRQSSVSFGEVVREERNIVAGHADAREHIRSFFKQVVNKDMLTAPGKKGSIVGEAGKSMSIIGLGDGAEIVEEFLNERENWDIYGPHLVSMAVMGGFFDREQIKVEAFGKFLKERSRAYIVCQEAMGTPLAGPTGNPLASHFTNYGCPVFSSGEPYHTEMMFITAHKPVLEFLRTAADDADYVNPDMEITYADEALVEQAKGEQQEWDGEEWEKPKEESDDEIEPWEKHPEPKGKQVATEPTVQETTDPADELTHEPSAKTEESVDRSVNTGVQPMTMGTGKATVLKAILGETPDLVQELDKLAVAAKQSEELPKGVASAMATMLIQVEFERLQAIFKKSEAVSEAHIKELDWLLKNNTEETLMEQSTERLRKVTTEEGGKLDEALKKLRERILEIRREEAKLKNLEASDDERTKDPVDPEQMRVEMLQKYNREQAALANKDLGKEQAKVAAGEISAEREALEEVAVRHVVGGKDAAGNIAVAAPSIPLIVKDGQIILDLLPEVATDLPDNITAVGDELSQGGHVTDQEVPAGNGATDQNKENQHQYPHYPGLLTTLTKADKSAFKNPLPDSPPPKKLHLASTSSLPRAGLSVASLFKTPGQAAKTPTEEMAPNKNEKEIAEKKEKRRRDDINSALAYFGPAKTTSGFPPGREPQYTEMPKTTAETEVEKKRDDFPRQDSPSCTTVDVGTPKVKRTMTDLVERSGPSAQSEAIDTLMELFEKHSFTSKDYQRILKEGDTRRGKHAWDDVYVPGRDQRKEETLEKGGADENAEDDEAGDKALV